MKVLYAGTYLAAGGLQGATGANWDGQQVNDEAEFFRAAAVTYFPRGNRSTRFGFGVNLSFNSEAAAIAFAVSHFNDIPSQGDIVVVDDAGTVAYKLANAVLDSITPRVVGIFVFVRYDFLGGVWASTTVPA